jgi:hypothetical protein
MFESISGGGAARIFSCPKCKETIDTSAGFCRFCGALVDTNAAEKEAEILALVNQACSDASFLKIMAMGVPISFVISFLPIVSMLGAWSLIFFCFAVPALTVRWWIKFSRLPSDDPEFRRARKTANLLSVLSVILFFAGLCLLFGMFVTLFKH